MEVKKSLYGENHEDVAKLVRNIGINYNTLEEGLLAIEYHEYALSLYKTRYGEIHDDIAISLWDIAKAYGTLNDYTKKIEYLEKSL